MPKRKVNRDIVDKVASATGCNKKDIAHSLAVINKILLMLTGGGVAMDLKGIGTIRYKNINTSKAGFNKRKIKRVLEKSDKFYIRNVIKK